jgi:malate/lactate dehydrogenase
MIHDEKWLQAEFMELVKKRCDTVEASLGHQASASRAAAITSLIHHWWSTSPQGQIFSLGVQSEGDH